jgi:twitching motility two-component system response regulator PilG
VASLDLRRTDGSTADRGEIGNVVNEGTGLLQDAIRAAKRGDGGLARSLLLRASEIEPRNDLVWLWLAKLAASAVDKVRYLRRVLAEHPRHEVARAELADVLLAQGIERAKAGKKTSSRELLEEARALDESREEVWLWLAAVAPTVAERRRCLERVLALNPNHRHALALLELPALRAEPAPQPVPGRRCPICRGIGFSGERCSWCRALFSLPDLKAMLKNSAVDRELIAAGLKRLAAVPGVQESFDAQLALGLGLLNLGEPDDAIAHFTVANRLRPEDDLLAAQLEVLALWRRRAAAPERLLRRGQVLVVDDSPTVLKLVAGSLEPHGFRVATAGAGLEALARLREAPPDLILLDINLPGMDGYQICKLIKADPALGRVPVVFLSGRGGLFDRMRGRLAGSADHIQKPFEPRALLGLVERFVAARNGV